MRNARYVILVPGQEPQTRTGDLTFDELRQAVGEPVEYINIDIGGKRAVMWACESGVEYGLPRNEAATRVAAKSLSDGDFIAGTAIVEGPWAAGGVTTSLPDDTLAELLGAIRSSPSV